MYQLFGFTVDAALQQNEEVFLARMDAQRLQCLTSSAIFLKGNANLNSILAGT